MILIADSSALIALSICDSLDLLDLLYGDVRVPQSVFDEVTAGNKVSFEKLYDYLKDKKIPVSRNDVALTDYSLGTGEIDSMILYKKLNADLLLIDDKRARKIADFNGINTIGSLGVLYEAKISNHIDEIRPALLKIFNSQIYISKSLCNFLLSSAGEEMID